MHRTQDASGARPSSRALLLAASVALVLALPVRADVTIQEKTVSTGIGGFGNGTTTRTRVIAGDKGREDEEFVYTGRMKTFAGKPRSTSTITRLDKELIWELDHPKKEYGEMTFAEMRAAMAKGIAQGQAEMKKPENARARQDVQVDYKVDVQRTGKREKVNGFDAEQWIITLTAVPKDKQSGQAAGAFKMKLDGWYSTQVPGQAELTAYYKRWAEKMGMDPQMRSMASGLMAMHGDAVREMAAKMKDLKGVAVRTTMTMDMDMGLTPEQQAQMDKAKADAATAKAEQKSKDDEASTSPSGMLGGFLAKRLAKSGSGGAPGAGGGSGFSVTTDLLSVTTGSAGASFEVPAGYKKVERKQK